MSIRWAVFAAAAALAGCGTAPKQAPTAGPEGAPHAVAGAEHAAAQPAEHGHAEHGRAEHGHAEHGRAEHGHGEHGHGEHGRAEHGHAEHGRAEHGHGEHGHGEHGRAEHGHAEHGHAEHAPLGHRFERAEDWTAHFDDAKRDAWQRPAEVIAAMAIEPGMTVADIGAGTGYFVPHLSAAVGAAGRVLAVDIERDMVRFLAERAQREGLANVEALLVRTDDPQLPTGGVDRVLIVNTWHHIPERRAYAAKLREALRPGGAVYVVDFTLDSERGPPKHHKLAPEVVAEELKAAGFDTAVDGAVLPDQYIVVAR